MGAECKSAHVLKITCSLQPLMIRINLEPPPLLYGVYHSPYIASASLQEHVISCNDKSAADTARLGTLSKARADMVAYEFMI